MSGNLLDGTEIAPAAADEADGTFLHLDVPHLRDGVSLRAHFPAAERKKCLGAGQRVCGRDLSDGISERHVSEETGTMSLGLQPCETKCKWRHKTGLRTGVVPDRIAL